MPSHSHLTKSTTTHSIIVNKKNKKKEGQGDLFWTHSSGAQSRALYRWAKRKCSYYLPSPGGRLPKILAHRVRGRRLFVHRGSRRLLCAWAVAAPGADLHVNSIYGVDQPKTVYRNLTAWFVSAWTVYFTSDTVKSRSEHPPVHRYMFLSLGIADSLGFPETDIQGKPRK